MWERFERTREGLKSLENVCECLRRPEKVLCVERKSSGFPFFLIKRPLLEVQAMKFEDRRRESNGSVRLLDEMPHPSDSAPFRVLNSG